MISHEILPLKFFLFLFIEPIPYIQYSSSIGVKGLRKSSIGVKLSV